MEFLLGDRTQKCPRSSRYAEVNRHRLFRNYDPLNYCSMKLKQQLHVLNRSILPTLRNFAISEHRNAASDLGLYLVMSPSIGAHTRR